MMAAWEAKTPAARPDLFVRAVWLELLVVLGIFLAALVLRTYRLDIWPPGLFADEAAYGLDALSVLGGERPIFFPRNTGREPLYPYLEAAMVALLGATPYALRLTAAIVGALAVPAAYWLVRELFWGSPLGARRLAFWSALFMAFGYWHISLSRIGFRANLLPLLAAITFALFWRAWRTLLEGRRFPWRTTVLTGVALGVTLYTYTAGRFMPILLALMVLVTLIPRNLTREVRLRAIGALALIAVTSAVVFAPLGAYFLQHPDQFTGRAASISIFSTEFAADGPLQALARAVGQTALLFLTLGDPNLRHNPAQRPAFDLLLGLWFYGGLALCLVRWRRLPYLFLALWTLLLALPAVLTAEATPHSLRAIGMIPAVYVLPVLAMLTAAAWLAARTHSHWRRWLTLLPLPFLLVSAATAVQGYFGAWQDLGRFNGVFMASYAQLAQDMTKVQDGGVWLLPLSPNYFLTEATFSTMDFLTAGRANYAGIFVDPEMVGAQLAAVQGDKGNLRLLVTQDSARFPEASYILGDPKHLVRFVLDKYGVQVGEHGDSTVGMPYLVYALPPRAGYPVFGPETPQAVTFDGKVTLTAASYGRTAGGEAGVDVNTQSVPSGAPLWVTLRWRADVPIDIDLKTSLSLRAPADHIGGQVDDLLVGDRYPLERVWEPGEAASSYHILPTVPALAPGRYDLLLRVYEDQTQRPYPVLDAAGQPTGIDTVIGSVEITPAESGPEPGQESGPGSPQAVAPQQPLPGAPELAPNLALLGYDLPTTTVAPGGTLPLTLYWQAPAVPAADYAARLQLRRALVGTEDAAVDGAGSGAAAVIQTQAIGGAYPTSRWAPDTTLRDWQDFELGADTPNGSYNLWLDLVAANGQPVGDALALGAITVAGRPPEFALPLLALPLAATFDQSVQLAGLQTAPPLSAAPGSSVELPLVWQMLEPDARQLVRFVHLLGADGRPVAQSDGLPCAGECPSATWLRGEVLRDLVTLALPLDVPKGEYTLAVGWYDSATLQRLEARDASGTVLPDGLVPLFPLTVTAAANP